MFVTLPGINTRFNPAQLEKALLSMSLTPSGISISVSPLHPEKTEPARRVNPGGNSTWPKRAHP